MSNPTFQEMRALTARLACTSIETQRILDRGYNHNVAAALPAARFLREHFGLAGALAVLPSRHLVQRMEIDTKLTLRRSRSFAFELMVMPINLGFRVSHKSTEDFESRIFIEVEQIPFPAAPVRPST